ncbi:uncharacterized protein LOC111127792 [Crassostrea virginica]
MADSPKQIYLGIAKDRINEDDRLDVLDSRTGMYKIKEYKPKRRSPKLREYKPQSRQFNFRKYEPQPELKVHVFDKIREYDHYYDVEPPDDDTDRPKREPPFCKPYKAVGSIKRTISHLAPR